MVQGRGLLTPSWGGCVFKPVVGGEAAVSWGQWGGPVGAGRSRKPCDGRTPRAPLPVEGGEPAVLVVSVWGMTKATELFRWERRAGALGLRAAKSRLARRRQFLVDSRVGSMVGGWWLVARCRATVELTFTGLCGCEMFAVVHGQLCMEKYTGLQGENPRVVSSS